VGAAQLPDGRILVAGAEATCLTGVMKRSETRPDSSSVAAQPKLAHLGLVFCAGMVILVGVLVALVGDRLPAWIRYAVVGPSFLGAVILWLVVLRRLSSSRPTVQPSAEE